MNKLLPTLFIAASTLVAVLNAAQAQDVSANIGTTNNYVWRGVTQTDKGFAVQGGADVEFDNGFSAGAWASNVDWGVGDVEVDIYGNYSIPLPMRFAEKGISANVGGIAYLYPAKPSSAAEANFVEVNAGLDFAVGPTTFSTSLAFSPDVAGETTWYYSGGLGIPLGDMFEVFGGVGYYQWEVTDGWMDYNVGVAATYLNYTLSGYYAGTDLDGDDGNFVIMLSTSFP
jgi:uncharacterized protein (TIGR02001 family)